MKNNLQCLLILAIVCITASGCSSPMDECKNVAYNKEVSLCIPADWIAELERGYVPMLTIENQTDAGTLLYSGLDDLQRGQLQNLDLVHIAVFYIPPSLNKKESIDEIVRKTQSERPAREVTRMQVGNHDGVMISNIENVQGHQYITAFGYIDLGSINLTVSIQSLSKKGYRTVFRQILESIQVAPGAYLSGTPTPELLISTISDIASESYGITIFETYVVDGGYIQVHAQSQSTGNLLKIAYLSDYKDASDTQRIGYELSTILRLSLLAIENEGADIDAVEIKIHKESMLKAETVVVNVDQAQAFRAQEITSEEFKESWMILTGPGIPGDLATILLSPSKIDIVIPQEPLDFSSVQSATSLPTNEQVDTDMEDVRLPEDGIKAINSIARFVRFYDAGTPEASFQFKIISAVRAKKHGGLNIPTSKIMANNSTPDEIWCVVIDPPADNFHNGGNFVLTDRFLVLHDATIWEAIPLINSADQETVWLNIGCNNWSDGIRPN